jgi:hypothetical protein
LTNGQNFPSHLMNEAQKLARHEIGHWIVARRLGFGAGDVTAKLTFGMGVPPIGRDGSSAITLRQDLTSIAETIDYLERRIQVCWAAVIAEALDPHQRRVDVEEACRLAAGQSGQTDAKIARELNQLLRNLKWSTVDGDTLTQLTTLSDDLSARTIKLVEENSELIIGLAGNLTDRLRAADIGVQATFSAAEIEMLPGVQQWVKDLGLPPSVPE